MNNWWVIVLLSIGSYLMGCFNNAIMITKIKKTDIRKFGSGNPGTMNMSRNFGIKLGLLTLFLDMLKGLIPALAGYFVLRGKTLPDAAFDLGDLGIFLCGFFAVPINLKVGGLIGRARLQEKFIVETSKKNYIYCVVSYS